MSGTVLTSLSKSVNKVSAFVELTNLLKED